MQPIDIERAKIIDWDRVNAFPQLSGNHILAKGVGCDCYKNYASEYLIIFKNRSKKYPYGKISLRCYRYGGTEVYKPQTFFNETDIRNHYDMEMQKLLQDTIHWLINEKIIKLT